MDAVPRSAQVRDERSDLSQYVESPRATQRETRFWQSTVLIETPAITVYEYRFVVPGFLATHFVVFLWPLHFFLGSSP